ncbi:hypothetical protein GPALN_012992 [Globodera pallida]|nr:hypothetical protein GPALN_012992 [Globodera pallida]
MKSEVPPIPVAAVCRAIVPLKLTFSVKLVIETPLSSNQIQKFLHNSPEAKCTFSFSPSKARAKRRTVKSISDKGLRRRLVPVPAASSPPPHPRRPVPVVCGTALSRWPIDASSTKISLSPASSSLEQKCPLKAIFGQVFFGLLKKVGSKRNSAWALAIQPKLAHFGLNCSFDYRPFNLLPQTFTSRRVWHFQGMRGKRLALALPALVHNNNGGRTRKYSF